MRSDHTFIGLFSKNITEIVVFDNNRFISVYLQCLFTDLKKGGGSKN